MLYNIQNYFYFKFTYFKFAYMKYDKKYYINKLKELSDTMDIIISSEVFDANEFKKIKIKFNLLFERMRNLF